MDLLAAAFRETAREAREARLLIVGNGEEASHIRTVLSQECTRGLVHIEPGVNHEQLPAWYRAMDLLVLPSRYENYSNALLEALACGVPCLASDIGGNRMLAETGAGWLFEANSVSALRQYLQCLIANRPALQARGEIGARAVRTHYSWAASAACLEAIITSRLGVKA